MWRRLALVGCRIFILVIDMDKIEICNLALSRLGVENIERIDETSEAARACNQFYEPTRRTVLRRFPWPFATRRVKLALIEGEPVDYEYAYRYPSDAIKIRELYAAECRRHVGKYKILSDDEGKVLYTDVELAAVEYTADIDDVSLFDDTFIEALSWKLASEIAIRLTNNPALASNAIQAYQAYFSEAAAQGTNEEKPKKQYVNPLEVARFNG